MFDNHTHATDISQQEVEDELLQLKVLGAWDDILSSVRELLDERLSKQVESAIHHIVMAVVANFRRRIIGRIQADGPQLLKFGRGDNNAPCAERVRIATRILNNERTQWHLSIEARKALVAFKQELKACVANNGARTVLATVAS